MKKHFAKLFIAAVSISVLGSRASAVTAFLEPYAGIGQVQVALHSSTYNDYDEKDIASGFTLGMKAGATFTQRFFAGLDYQTGGPYTFGRVNGKGEWTFRMLGAGVGMDYDLARFWAGYYFDHTIEDTKNRLIFKGDAYKIGFGLKVAKNVHANLDVVIHNLKTVEAMGGGGSFTITKPPQVQSVFASISLPIDLK